MIGEDDRDLEELADQEDEDLIFTSDNEGSSQSLNSFNSAPSLPDAPDSPTVLQEQDPGMQTLSPPRRPPIYDEDGEEMKIPEMSDEDFNASFGEHLAKTGKGVSGTERTLEAVAGATESAGAGAAVVAGASKVLKTILNADDNDLDQIDTKHTEKTDQAAYHSNNVTQATSQTTQATAQAAGQSTQAAAAVANP